MRLRPISAVLSAVAASLIAMACGGSSSGTGTSSTARAEAPTRAVFIKRGDAICEQTDKKQETIISAYLRKHPKAKANKSGQEGIVLVALPPIQVEAEELNRLQPPNGDESEIKVIVSRIEEAVNESKADPSKLIGTLSRGPFTAAGKLAAKYGFKACAFPL